MFPIFVSIPSSLFQKDEMHLYMTIFVIVN